jgi:hypothetical protein
VRVRVVGNTLALILALLIPSPGCVRGQARESPRYDPAKAPRAIDLLEQARIAAGGKEELQRVATLSVSLRVRRFVRYIAVSPRSVVQKEKTLNGKLSIELQLPDRFRKDVSSTTLLGNHYSYAEVVNGERAWREPALQAQSSNRDPRLVDVSDFERSLAYQARSVRQQLAFYVLAWLIRVLPGEPLKFNYEGWMQADGVRADVISAFGSGDYGTLLMLDQKTHLPTEFDSSFSGVRSLPVVLEGIPMSRRDFNLMVEKARAERKAQITPPRSLIIKTQLSDYRPVSGILFPHRMVTSIDGKPLEELLIRKIDVNQRLKPKDFEPNPRFKPKAR